MTEIPTPPATWRWSEPAVGRHPDALPWRVHCDACGRDVMGDLERAVALTDRVAQRHAARAHGGADLVVFSVGRWRGDA